jgi:mannose-6-phosphate isomerase
LGEAWLTGSECRFAPGPFAGRTLGEVWPEMPVEWTGTRADRKAGFPLLVKFIFSEDKLSIQVHPDDDYAARHEMAAGGRGKTEMWYTVHARHQAEVLVGLKPDVTRERLTRAISDRTAEACLKRVALREGDAVFVPAGTAHTIGPGLVLCEIQEQSDLTYRVYDYDRRDALGRSRELHIEKALEVIRFGKQRGGKINPVRIKNGPVAETFFTSCRYFATEKWEFSERVTTTTSPEHFDLMIVLHGTGSFIWNDSRAAFASAQVWMIPAALSAYQIEPASQTVLLRAYVPSDRQEFARRMHERGLNEAEWLHLVHW